jgi:hypothetical protein
MFPFMRGWLSWVVVGLVLWIATASGAANSDVKSCRQVCKDDYQQAVTEPDGCLKCNQAGVDCSSCPGLDDAISGRDDCLDCLKGSCASGDMPSFFDTCTGQCASPKPGVCALNLTCVRRCRVQLGMHQQQCRTRFQKQVRSVCRLVACGADPNYFVTAKRQRRQCERACKTEGATATRAAPAPAVDATPVAPLQSSGLPPGCNCQQKCIRGNVGKCYDDCNSACMGDRDALNLCQRACRNAQCAALRKACASDSASPSISYAACCSQCASSGACDEDKDMEEICTPTTSTTSTSTTSTSSTTTGPTTTTFAGQTTTTTTTTIP